MGIEAVLARGAQIFAALAGAYLVALWFVLAVWTYRDIESRSKNVVTQIFSTLLVVLFSVPGVLLYMILRPKETLDSTFQRSLEEEYLLQDLEELPLCPSCQRYVEDDFVLCPHCQTKLRDNCHACGRLVDLKWSICPYCSADQSKEAVAAALERVEAPEPRFIAAKSSDAPEERSPAIGPGVTEPATTPGRSVAAGERTPAVAAGNGRGATEAPLPFTIVAGTPGRPVTGRFRPSANGTNGRRAGANGTGSRTSAEVATTNGRDAEPDGHATDDHEPVLEIPATTDSGKASGRGGQEGD